MARTSQEYVIRTGIPSLDGLFGGQPGSEGFRLSSRRTTTSASIVGQDGTGKSLLAMHLMSRYMADSAQISKHNLAFYVSTDLTYRMAKRMWTEFALDLPNERVVPFLYPQLGDTEVPEWLAGKAGKKFDRKLEVELALVTPDNVADLASAIVDVSRGRDLDSVPVRFLDLASHDSGDEWGLLHRLLACLSQPSTGPPHIIVIDAVEGLETYAGELDVFGERISRRTRVAQLIRLSTGRAHLILAVEEPEPAQHLPEQFVTDVVVRLRNVASHNYVRRTLEVEKTRGQYHVRGRHPYVIRSGMGSTSGGKCENYDDPRVVHPRGGHQPYIHVFPSLHYFSRREMEVLEEERVQPFAKCAGFGVEHLDDMLAKPRGSEADDGTADQDRGLPYGTVSALMGEAGTQKTGLGISFLAQAFRDLVRPLGDRADSPSNSVDLSAERNLGAAVMITSQDENSRRLADYFVDDLARMFGREQYLNNHANERRWLRDLIAKRTVCRRLEIHDLPSAVLLHAIRRAIQAAHALVEGKEVDAASIANEGGPDPTRRFQNAGAIRVVVDDLSTIMDTFSHVREDPLFLPALLRFFRREGVTTLIVNSHAGLPGVESTAGANFHSELLALSDHRLHTWRVTNFFGDHRVAIAAIPPLTRRPRVLVRELKWRPPGRKQAPLVDPGFELYAGLEEDEPRLVPLRVHLFAESEVWEHYVDELNDSFRRLFEGLRTGGEVDDGQPVVVGEPCDQYGGLRSFCEGLSNTKLDYTLVVQVDEFWRRTGSLRPARRYLSGDFRVASGGPPRDVSSSRLEAFEKAAVRWGSRLADSDRVPFTWDFGFLALRQEPWVQCANRDRKRIQERGQSASTGVSSTLNCLQQGKSVSWREFAGAAIVVGRWNSDFEGGASKAPSFDLAMMASQSFPCLVLEMWASEIFDSIMRYGDGPEKARQFARRLNGVSGAEDESFGLRAWLTGPRPGRQIGEFEGYALELYKAWLLLVELLDLDSFTGDFALPSGRPAATDAVSVRHWYKTAAQQERTEGWNERFCYARLPGHFAVRGDWFLSVASGSRSDLLGDKALDELSSELQNQRRLLLGLGLPTRSLGGRDEMDKLRTALTREKEGHRESLKYGTLRNDLGENEKSDFFYLWRSTLDGYAAATSIWEAWLYRVIRRWRGLQRVQAGAWTSGLEVYDDIELLQQDGDRCLEVRLKEKLRSFVDFPERCNDLLAQLRWTDDGS